MYAIAVDLWHTSYDVVPREYRCSWYCYWTRIL